MKVSRSKRKYDRRTREGRRHQGTSSLLLLRHQIARQANEQIAEIDRIIDLIKKGFRVN